MAQKCKAIAYASRLLNPAERNYAISERECLVVIWGLEKLRPYFYKLRIKIVTDHRDLEHLSSEKKLSARRIWCTLCLNEFNITIGHRPSASNTVTDCLSRQEEDWNEIVKFSLLTSWVIQSRQQLIEEQRKDPELS